MQRRKTSKTQKKFGFSIIPVYRTTIGKCDTYIIIILLYFYKIIYINKSYCKIHFIFGLLIGHTTHFRYKKNHTK